MHSRQSPISSRKRSTTIVAVRRHDARGRLLLAQEVDQVARGEPVEVVVGLEPLRALVDRPAAEGADLAPELLGTADAVAAPERHGARRARRGRDGHAVAADVLDPPGGGAEQERLARARLVDHLLVELADAPPVGQDDGEQAAVGDRAGVGHGELARAAPGPDRPGDAIPDDARAQLAELLRRVAPVEHVEHVLEQLPAELGEAVGAGDERVQLVDGDDVGLRRGGDRDDLLGEDVERVARHDGRLDPALAHELRDDRALEQVGAELGEDAALADVADVVAGAPDALQAAADGLRRLDLEHEIDGAHVDAELERRGGDEARQLAGLEHLLDDDALLARERPVVGARDVLLGELVEAQGEALRAAAVVDEDDRRAVLAHERQQLGIDRGPDRLARRLAAGERIERVGGIALVGLDHRLDRHVDLQVQRLAHARVDDPRGAPRADHEAADLLERVLGRAQADALRVAARLLGQALEREREVRAALRGRDGVDLVDDHGLDAAEHVARLRGEDQVQRLGRRDEDVGRRAPHGDAVALRACRPCAPRR